MLKLHKYQELAVEQALKQKRLYFAMDMGLGKTLTSIASAHEAGRKHILLVAEKNEIVNSENFKKEVEEYFDDLSYVSLRDVKLKKMQGTMRTVCGINPDALVRLDMKMLTSLFDAIIIDEATLAKTTSTARFKVIKKICGAMDYVYLLSGTPMMNGASELYAPLLLLENYMVRDKKADGKKAFEDMFCNVSNIKNRHAKIKWLQFIRVVSGAKNVRVLRYLLRNSFFFLNKEQTGLFKKKTRTIEKVTMTTKWFFEYTQAWNKYLVDAKKRDVNVKNVTELRALIEQGRVYQLNSKYKARRVVEDIARGKYGDKRIVVYSMFIETDELLKEELTKRGVSFRSFEDVNEWKKGTEQVLIGRIIAHGKGTNLPEASVALFVDMSFVPTQNLQAEGRIDRPEQKNEMLIVYYITNGEDIIDNHVRNINREKMANIKEFMRPFTEAELKEMPSALAELKRKYPEKSALLEL